MRCQREGQKAAGQGGERGGYPGQARAERTGTGMTIWPIGRYNGAKVLRIGTPDFHGWQRGYGMKIVVAVQTEPSSVGGSCTVADDSWG